jgi:hypothetical protein
MIMRTQRGGCRVWAAGYLSHPRDVVKRGNLSTQDEVYASRMALEAVCPRALVPSVLQATAPSLAPQISRHTSRLTETNDASREYERGMMHTPEF